MKKLTALCCMLAASLSLTACGSTPSDKEIKAALDEGTITVEDAKAKGWIDDEWIKENFEQIEAQSKIYLFDPFETTYLDGTPASSEIIHDTMCLVFFDTTGEKTMENLKAFQEAKDGMEAAGVPLLGILTDDDPAAAQETLKDINFPVIIYNDEMKKSMEPYKDMVEQDLTASFTRNGGFYTAWYTTVNAQDLVETAEGLVSID